MLHDPSPAILSTDSHPCFGVIPGLVWAFRIQPDGKAEPLPIDAIIDAVHSDLLWLHFNLADSRALQWLAQTKFRAPEQARMLLLARNTHQQVLTSDDCVYGVISDLLRDIDGATEETGFLRFFMTEHLLVSGRHRALCAVDVTRRSLENGHLVSSEAALLEIIVENVADTMNGVADGMAVALDEIEEQVLSRNSKEALQSLSRLRRTCVRLHRQLSGLRTVFHRLEHKGVDNLKPRLKIRAGKLAQRLDELDHRIVEMRERSRLLQEELHLQIEQQGNESLRVLSLLTSLLLPPTLITGIFGMNTKGLPLTNVDSGFLWALALIVVSSVSAYFLIKRIGLIS